MSTTTSQRTATTTASSGHMERYCGSHWRLKRKIQGGAQSEIGRWRREHEGGKRTGGREIERKTSVGGGWGERGTKTAGCGRMPAEVWWRKRRGKG
ncbi:hypothetical protein MtrunA17_Chr8g0339621 [Medicago truncatula]|uniref:Uncharacterized protein n=1 Tax=Medicago truncatula TaxID=3880 RepID=A0A396GBR1_MEDTR|nr:hypothetical protein MtrunA17_Chr8g0339621 [Medicago truncatula]